MKPLTAVLLAALTVAIPAAAQEEVGEYSTPAVTPLAAPEVERMRELVRTDAEARALAEEATLEALPLLAATPDPLEVIHYEGLVNTDPRRIASVGKLRQLADAATLVRYWQISGDPRAAATLQRFINAWSGTYRPTGNDVNENKLYPLLVAYEALRDDYPAAERERVDAWVRHLGILHEEAVQSSTGFNNRYSKHVRLLAIAGIILDRADWVHKAREGVERFVAGSLRSDGSSVDLETRDALSYHASALRPVIELARLAGEDGASLYRWIGPEGGSIKKSVDFVTPYALGEKTRAEWVNTTVGLDRRRAQAGLEHYRPGRLYHPEDALELMEEASYFDPELLRVVRHLTRSGAERFPTWQTLVNAAARAPVSRQLNR